jgi:hypothetical protein
MPPLTNHPAAVARERQAAIADRAEQHAWDISPYYRKNGAEEANWFVCGPKGLEPCQGKERFADRYSIRLGDEIVWHAAGEVIRVIPPGKEVAGEDRESRLRLFGQATESVRAKGRNRAEALQP